jgi:hypothetical protein
MRILANGTGMASRAKTTVTQGVWPDFLPSGMSPIYLLVIGSISIQWLRHLTRPSQKP